MEVVVTWQALIDLIEPHYPKTSKMCWRPPHPLATMLRIHLVPHWYPLSEPAMGEAPKTLLNDTIIIDSFLK